ncbi:MAG: alanine dehydrogenase [Gallionella sp.]|nr:alanine dehydrogenase [Gallionella sp.]MDD4947310.1 alanine dehydrogenase [Gallionella sp.]MDD5612792.1 alanine dehydrogenase [Gallionella sp.]
MRIGIPKEIKTNENRVSLTPAGAAALSGSGHQVLVETDAGSGSGFSNADYLAAGAEIAPDAATVWSAAELIVKVKEPVESEWPLLRPGQTIFTYFHFAASLALTEAHLASGATCIAYETVQLPDGELPLLTPMSEVAGRMAVQEGAKHLEKLSGGRGILLAGVPGVPPAKVVILGGGTVGMNAARMAAGLGASVVLLDTSLPRLRQLSHMLPANVQLVFSNRHAILEQIACADLVIGAVLIPGAAAPKLLRREDLKLMRPGAVIVDVAIDQGGCVETMHPTTHQQPTFVVDGIVHYAVANMPGGVPLTATLALTNATLPYVQLLADQGWRQAACDAPDLRAGLNIVAGQITHRKVAEAFGLPWRAADSLLT